MQDRDFGRPISRPEGRARSNRLVLPTVATLALLAAACGFAGEKKSEEVKPESPSPVASETPIAVLPTQTIQLIESPTPAFEELTPTPQVGNPQEGEEIRTGLMFPDFELSTIDGQKVKLSDFRGKPLVLFYITPDCYGDSQCRQTILDVSLLRFKVGENIEVVAIGQDQITLDFLKLATKNALLDEKYFDSKRSVEFFRVQNLINAGSGLTAYFIKGDGTLSSFTHGHRVTQEWWTNGLRALVGEPSSGDGELVSEAFFDLGKLRMDLIDWQEPQRQGMVEFDGVSSKPIEIKAVVFNTSQEPVDIESIDWKTKESEFQFDLESLDGRALEGIIAEVWQDLIMVGELNRSNKSFWLPPGFGLPITIIDEIPQEVDDYQLKVESFSRAVPAPQNVIKKGQKAETPPLIDPGVEIKNPNEIWDYPNLSLAFLGTYIEQEGTFQSQRVQISITNKTGELLKNIGGAKLLVYLKDGRIVYGDLSEFYPEEYLGYLDVIDPHGVRTYPVRIGFDDTTYEDRSRFEIFDLSGSIAVLSVNSQVWGAWNLK